jgi:predicted DsbA family dithiol-disulfide isomerase
MTITVAIVSDVICPWFFLGKRPSRGVVLEARAAT